MAGKICPSWSLQLYLDYHGNHNIADLEENQIATEKGEILPCTLCDAKLVCSPIEKDTHNKLI